MVGIEKGIEETIKALSNDPTWRNAVVNVLKNPYNKDVIAKAAQSVNLPIDIFKSRFLTYCWDTKNLLVPMFKENARLYTPDQIERWLAYARVLGRHPETLGVGGGTLTTGAGVGIGTKITVGFVIKWVAITIAVGIVTYYGFGYLGGLAADDPIESTVIGDPEKRPAFQQAEQEEKQRDAEHNVKKPGDWYRKGEY